MCMFHTILFNEFIPTKTRHICYFSLPTKICGKHNFAARKVMIAVILMMPVVVIWLAKRGTQKIVIKWKFIAIKTPYIFYTFEFIPILLYLTCYSITENPFLHLCLKVNHLNIPPQTMKYGFQHSATMAVQNPHHVITWIVVAEKKQVHSTVHQQLSNWKHLQICKICHHPRCHPI